MKLAILLVPLFLVISMASRVLNANRISSFDKPDFCNGLDCPPFTVVRTLEGGVELRKYSPGRWVSVDMSGVSYKEAMSKGFMTLFGYISGANADGRKIDMTAPVKTHFKPGPGPLCQEFTISFYLPYEFQDNNSAPAPTEKGVYLDSAPSFEVYVGTYGGFSSEDKIIEQAGRVIEQINKAGEKYDTSVWLGAGYNPPFQLKNRHNEVWIPKA